MKIHVRGLAWIELSNLLWICLWDSFDQMGRIHSREGPAPIVKNLARGAIQI